jgi:hypothetical protein
MPSPISLLSILAAGLVAGSAVAQTSTPQPAVPTSATPQVVIENAPQAIDPGAEIVCRKVKETGSLIKSKKTCHTKSQWAYIDEQHQRLGRQMVQDGTTRPAGN